MSNVIQSCQHSITAAVRGLNCLQEHLGDGGGSFLLVFGEISENVRGSAGEQTHGLGPAWGKANGTECIQYRFERQEGRSLAIRPAVIFNCERASLPI